MVLSGIVIYNVLYYSMVLFCCTALASVDWLLLALWTMSDTCLSLSSYSARTYVHTYYVCIIEFSEYDSGRPPPSVCTVYEYHAESAKANSMCMKQYVKWPLKPIMKWIYLFIYLFLNYYWEPTKSFRKGIEYFGAAPAPEGQPYGEIIFLLPLDFEQVSKGAVNIEQSL